MYCWVICGLAAVAITAGAASAADEEHGCSVTVRN